MADKSKTNALTSNAAMMIYNMEFKTSWANGGRINKATSKSTSNIGEKDIYICMLKKFKA